MNPYLHIYRVDIRKGMRYDRARAPVGQGDALADRFVVSVFDDGTPVDLTGGKVLATVIRPDDITVPVDGTVEDGAACVTLDDMCYDVSGDIIVTISIELGEMRQTLLQVSLNVSTRETTVIAETPIWNLADLGAAVQRAEEAAKRAEEAAGSGGGGTGGTGTVTSVNGVGPDEAGNVEIDIPEPPTKLSELEGDSGHRLVSDTEKAAWDAKSTFSGKYTDLQGAPEIPEVPDWSMQPEKPTYTAKEVGALPSTYTPPDQTAAQVGADPAGTAANRVSAHNTDDEAHQDLRTALELINTRLTAFFDSDDQTLDELSEIVAYITSNKSLINAITTSKVNVSDIVNNLTTNIANRPLSAAQGVALKALIDAIAVPTKLSELAGDTTHRVVTDAQMAAWDAKSDFGGSYNDLTDTPTIPTVPDSLVMMGELSDSADLNNATLADGVYELNGCKASNLPVSGIYGSFVQLPGDYRAQLVIGGGSGVGSIYSRRYLTASKSWTAWTESKAGADGKSAYAYAQDGGYTGTEAEFAAALGQTGSASAAQSRPNFHTIAHRGYHAYATQNSLQSFIDAAEAGFAWIEMDIRYCKDGVYILSHDPTITAYNNGTAVSVTIADSNYADIKTYTLDAAGVHPICTFATAMAVLRGYNVGVICDRSGGTNAELVEIAARQGMADRIMLSYQYPRKPFLDHELPVLEKYKTIPIRIVPTDYEDMQYAMKTLANTVYADVNAYSADHYKTYLNNAMSCGAPILFSGCTLTDSNKNRWAGIACGGMAHENDNISPDEFMAAITADYAARSTITVSVDSLTIAADGTADVMATSDLATIAGCLYAYSRNPLVATVTQTSFGQSIGFTVTGVAEGNATEIVVFSPNGEQTVVPVSVGEVVDTTLVYELPAPVTFTASGVDQVIDTGYALNAVDRDWTIAFEFIPKANINSTLWSCVDETTGSATLTAGHQFRVSYGNNYYYVNGGMNSATNAMPNLSPQNDTTTYRVVVRHTASENALRTVHTDASGNIVDVGTATWAADKDVRNDKTLLIGGRYGTDGNIYGSTSSSLWQGTVNNFRVYERKWSDSETTAYLSST